MSEVAGIVVAHSELASGLVRAAEEISGVKGALAAISNTACTPEELRARVRRAASGRPAVIFVDLASGSCAFASLSVAGGLPEVAVVTGVNLPMLLDFLFHRAMSPAELAGRVVDRGRATATVRLPRPEAADADPAVSD